MYLQDLFIWKYVFMEVRACLIFQVENYYKYQTFKIAKILKAPSLDI